MSYIWNLATARVQQATQSLRILVPVVEDALVAKFGPDWPAKVGKLLHQKENLKLHDTRFLLKVLGWRYDGGKGEPLISIMGIEPAQAHRLMLIAHMARHDHMDPRWNEGDDLEAERIAASFLIATGKRLQRVTASVPGRHQEIFELSDRLIRHRWYHLDDEAWSNWAEMPCSSATSIAAAGQADRIDIFILTTSGIIETRTWALEGTPELAPSQRTGGWRSWRGLPNGDMLVAGPIVASSLLAGHIELFAFGERMETVHRWSMNDDWQPWRAFDQS